MKLGPWDVNFSCEECGYELGQSDVFRGAPPPIVRSSFDDDECGTSHSLVAVFNGYFLMLASLRATVGIVVWVAFVDMRIITSFAPRIFGWARLSPSVASTLLSTQRWMSNADESATQLQQEQSEEEKAAIKAAREARK